MKDVGGAASGADDARRPIWLCADDYGFSTSVNRAIRDLVARGRINATSVAVAAPGFSRSEAASLKMLNAGTRRVAIGLHVALTGPFRPMSAGFRASPTGAFMTLEQMFVRACLRLLDREQLMIELTTQLKTFVGLFGSLPEFVDGHQHVQLFPQVRDALLKLVKDEAPDAWVRQCGSTFAPRWLDNRAWLLDRLSRKFKALAAAQGIRSNPAFAGTYDFTPDSAADFSKLFPRFLDGLPAESVVMCHPGLVDAELTRLDPLTDLRDREYSFLANEAFPALLRAHGVALAAA